LTKFNHDSRTLSTGSPKGEEKFSILEGEPFLKSLLCAQPIFGQDTTNAKN